MDKGLSSRSQGVNALTYGAVTADADGVAIDRKGFTGLTFYVTAGARTDGAHTFGLERSDDGGTTWTDIPATDIHGTLPVIDGAEDDDQVYAFDYLGLAPMVRVTVAVAGATTGAVYGVFALQHQPSYAGNHALRQ